MAFGDDTASTSVPVPWGGILVLGVLAVGLVALGPSASPRSARLRRNGGKANARRSIKTEEDGPSLTVAEARAAGEEAAEQDTTRFLRLFENTPRNDRMIAKLEKEANRFATFAVTELMLDAHLSHAAEQAFADAYSETLFDAGYERLMEPEDHADVADWLTANRRRR